MNALIALSLMQALFATRSLKSLEIQNLVQTSPVDAEISYHVAIDDRRDPRSPAINEMSAKAEFCLRGNQWALCGVRDLEQTLVFEAGQKIKIR